MHAGSFRQAENERLGRSALSVIDQEGLGELHDTLVNALAVPYTGTNSLDWTTQDEDDFGPSMHGNNNCEVI